MKIIICMILVIIALYTAFRSGVDQGARQMARHILNPDYETLKFYEIMNEECGQSNGVLRVNKCCYNFQRWHNVTWRLL